MQSQARYAVAAVGLAAAGQIVFSAAAGAQATDAAKIEQLQRVIEAQQRQLEAQSQTLRALQQQVEELRASTSRAQTTAQQAADTARQASQQAEQAAVPTDIVTSGEDNIELAISGQVNRALLYSDDGESQDLFHVDNSNSSTRVRFVGTGQVTDDLLLGAQIELEFESNPSSDVSQIEERNVGPNSFTERKLEVFAESSRYGTLWIGQGDTASNTTSEVDLSGTSVVGYSNIPDMAGGLLFRDKSTGQLTTTTIGDVFENFDGLSRDDRIRYDTPTFAGFTGSASAIADDRWDVSLFYAADFGAFKAGAAVAYADANSADIGNRVNGSVSVLHESGINVTFAAGRDEPDIAGRDDPNFWYAKLGYIANPFAFGPTAFAIDYTEAEGVDQNGDEATEYGLFVVQSVEDFGTDFYLGLRNHELDRRGASLDDIFAAMTGARVKF